MIVHTGKKLKSVTMEMTRRARVCSFPVWGSVLFARMPVTGKLLQYVLIVLDRWLFRITYPQHWIQPQKNSEIHTWIEFVGLQVPPVGDKIDWWSAGIILANIKIFRSHGGHAHIAMPSIICLLLQLLMASRSSRHSFKSKRWHRINSDDFLRKTEFLFVYAQSSHAPTTKQRRSVSSYRFSTREICGLLCESPSSQPLLYPCLLYLAYQVV